MFGSLIIDEGPSLSMTDGRAVAHFMLVCTNPFIPLQLGPYSNSRTIHDWATLGVDDFCNVGGISNVRKPQHCAWFSILTWTYNRCKIVQPTFLLLLVTDVRSLTFVHKTLRSKIGWFCRFLSKTTARMWHRVVNKCKNWGWWAGCLVVQGNIT